MDDRIVTAAGAGTYAAVAVAILLFAVEQVGTVAVPGSPAGWAVAVGALAASAGWLAPGPTDLLRDRLAVVVLAVLPVPAALLAFGGSDGTTAWVVGAVLLAAVGSLLLRHGACTRHALRRTSGTGSRAPLPEPSDRRGTRLHTVLYVVAGAFWLLLAAASVASGGGPWPLEFALGVGFLVAALPTSRSYVVTEAGLLVETRFDAPVLETWLDDVGLGSRFGASLFEWDAFDGYYLDGELVLLRSAPFRSDIRFDRDAVDDATLAALDAHLVRSKIRTVPASGVVPYEDEHRDSAAG